LNTVRVSIAPSMPTAIARIVAMTTTLNQLSERAAADGHHQDKDHVSPSQPCLTRLRGALYVVNWRLQRSRRLRIPVLRVEKGPDELKEATRR
jgi:hypothetical protein